MLATSRVDHGPVLPPSAKIEDKSCRMMLEPVDVFSFLILEVRHSRLPLLVAHAPTYAPTLAPLLRYRVRISAKHH
jgi:hypothetical protein